MSKKTKRQNNGATNVKDNEFDCPICGNGLIESQKDRIQCKWCNQTIIPKSKRRNRLAQIYVKQPAEDFLYHKSREQQRVLEK